jgi:hypothetical protein
MPAARCRGDGFAETRSLKVNVAPIAFSINRTLEEDAVTIPPTMQRHSSSAGGARTKSVPSALHGPQAGHAFVLPIDGRLPGLQALEIGGFRPNHGFAAGVEHNEEVNVGSWVRSLPPITVSGIRAALGPPWKCQRPASCSRVHAADQVVAP